jgi:ectoine hydroxylase-related dioxygenase (phytanoyl-CoA dioxygenase family)
MTATLTADAAQARMDLAEHGYCVLEGALTAERTADLRDRLATLAADEVRRGVDYVYDGGANQRVWNLLNKGDEWVELVLDPLALDMAEHLLWPGFLLSNLDANIAGPGGSPMFLHADQSYCPPPWPHPLVINVIWMLDEFSEENGATRVVPGSHTLGYGPDSTEVETAPILGPAGSAAFIDGRLWHQTGANTTAHERRHAILGYYCRPFIRQQENFFLSLDPAVPDRHPPRLRQLLGYEIYASLGMVGGPPRDLPRW